MEGLTFDMFKPHPRFGVLSTKNLPPPHTRAATGEKLLQTSQWKFSSCFAPLPTKKNSPTCQPTKGFPLKNKSPTYQLTGLKDSFAKKNEILTNKKFEIWSKQNPGCFFCEGRKYQETCLVTCKMTWTICFFSRIVWVSKR